MAAIAEGQVQVALARLGVQVLEELQSQHLLQGEEGCPLYFVIN